MRFLIAVFALSLQILDAQEKTLPATEGCSAELRGNRPRIYIGNFLVTYGKRDMGQAIGDFIAQKFQADGRFDVIPRPAIHEEMQSVIRKNLKTEKYLTMTVDLAAARQADCVIFGRISRQKNRVSFVVRMASVSTGLNLRKVDAEVERDDALAFLENVGDSFVAYFSSAPAAPATVAAETEGRHGFYLSFAAGGGYLSASGPFGSDGFSTEAFSGYAGMRVGGAIRPDVILHGSFDGFMGFSPVGKVVSNGAPEATTLSEIRQVTLLTGLGITLFNESNYFVSATLGPAASALGFVSGANSVSAATKIGFGVSLSLGRQWQIARRWGIGTSLLGHYTNIPSAAVATNQYYLGIALSVTYN